MPSGGKRSKKRSIDWRAIPGILDELESLLTALEDEDAEDFGYRLDALITSFIGSGLVPKGKLRPVKFHTAIEAFVLPLPDRDSLAELCETFEDLINAYGDEPSEDEMERARDILEKVVAALKDTLREGSKEDQLPLP